MFRRVFSGLFVILFIATIALSIDVSLAKKLNKKQVNKQVVGHFFQDDSSDYEIKFQKNKTLKWRNNGASPWNSNEYRVTKKGVINWLSPISGTKIAVKKTGKNKYGFFYNGGALDRFTRP